MIDPKGKIDVSDVVQKHLWYFPKKYWFIITMNQLADQLVLTISYAS